jgi:hypothetical protein
MKVTVVVPDRSITVDNNVLVIDDDDWNFDDSHVHAIHWNEISGELEYIDTSENEELTTIDLVQPYIDKFFEELPRIERIRIQREEESLSQRESRLQRMRVEQEEQERILQKIRETSEENRRLRDQSRISFEREQEAKRLKDEAEKQLLFQKEIDKKKLERESIDLEISNKIRIFDEDIKQKTDQLKGIEEQIISKQDELTDIFENKLGELFDQRGSMLSMIDDERAELDRQRREYLEYREQKESQDSLLEEEMNARSESIRLEKESQEQIFESQQNQLNLQRESLDSFRNEMNSNSQNFADELIADREEWERERRLTQDRLALEQEEILVLQRELELRRQQLEQDENDFSLRERNFDTILDNEKEIFESKLYEEKARLEAERIFADNERTQLHETALQQQGDAILEIASTSDPLNLFSLIDVNNFDIKNLPIVDIITFFSKMKRAQDFCSKYNLNWKQIQNNPDLQERLEQYLEEGERSPE